MKGDLSRNTFDRARHYRSVRLQQGRIVTDADWNEQADLTHYRARQTARDVIGLSGAPFDAAGFALQADTRALAVLAINANVAWIAAEDGALLGTTNGGSTWSVADLGTAAHLRALAAANGALWVVGDGGTIRCSTDGGLIWRAQDGGTAQSLRGVTAVDADHAWIVGDKGTVLSTQDGGASWQQGQSGVARLRAVHFLDTLTGVAVGVNGAIVLTDDGGQTWTAADVDAAARGLHGGPTGQINADADAANSVGTDQPSHLLCLARVGFESIWAAGHDGSILLSTDGGATWSRADTPSATTVRAIAFADTHRGWAVGDDGEVWETVDGGNHWLAGAFITNATLRGLGVLDDDEAWVVGDDATAWRIGNGSPDTFPLALPAVNLAIAPGRYYVDGTLCELDARVTYGNQADGGAGLRLPAGAHLIYLHVWERHVSALQAPWIREVALGGPDTATRSQVLAQVRALPLAAASPAQYTCDSYSAEWDALLHPSPGRLAARATPQPATRTLCDIAATAGYRRLENQLYRVEVHDGGDEPTFKWSRENGSVAYAVIGVSVDTARQQTTVRVTARGRDEGLDLSAHDRVELIDDTRERWGRVGQMFEYLADGDDDNELVLAGVPAGTLGQDPAAWPLLRRWEQRPASSDSHVSPFTPGVWIELEEGVEVRFEPGEWRPGDYWLVPARTITGDVEWPREPDTGDPAARAPEGVADAYCRLGIVEVDDEGGLRVLADCRDLFPPLTRMTQLLYGSGDGQEGAPGGLLPQPLAVRIMQGSLPVAGARVRFDIETGNGRVGQASAGNAAALAASFETVTNASGEARCRWRLGPTWTAPARFQRVRASLVDADGFAHDGQAIVFCAAAVAVLQYVSGDGQQGTPGANLPALLEMRVANGNEGVSGATLLATVAQGGGAVVGSRTLTTDPQGLATVAWRMGTGGPQRLRVDLMDAQGRALQHLSFNASFGGGAREIVRRASCVTIGEGGDVERLDASVLASLLRDNANPCLCFLPGDHLIEGLEASGDGSNRLSLHGCGPTALVRVRGGMLLGGLGALELRDLTVQLEDERGIALRKIADVQVSGVAIARKAGAREPCLQVGDVRTVRITASTIDTTMPGVAVVLQNIDGDCHLSGNTITGILSIYGPPGDVLPATLLRRLHEGSRQAKLVAGGGQLKLTDNRLALLTIGESMVKQLMDARTAEGLFDTATIGNNTFTDPANLFVAARMIAVHHSTLLGDLRAERVPLYGVFIAERATAVGNIGLVPGIESGALLFGAPQFVEAANLVTVRN